MFNNQRNPRSCFGQRNEGGRTTRRWLLLFFVAANIGLLLPLAGRGDAPRQTHTPLQAERFEAFVDGLWFGQRSEPPLAGAVIVAVQNDEVLLAKGYGFADAASRAAVDPERTLFRIASISKPFTWLAVMQLVETGKLDLDRNINEYLTDFEVPSSVGGVITMRHLMSHSAGFEDRVLDLGRRRADELIPLGEYLKTNFPLQIRAPGEFSSYSNHSTALAAHIVATVAGQDWSMYLEQNILVPLGMTRTVVRHPFPEHLLDDLATPHDWSAGAFQAQEFLHWFIYPAGMISSTGSDMIRLIKSLLGDGRGLMQPETFDAMLEPSYRAFDGANAWRHGFMELSRGGEFIYGHGGDLNAFHSMLLIMPERDLGVFLSFNSETGAAARNNFTRALREWLIPIDAAPPVSPRTDAEARQHDLVGQYAPLRHSVSDFAKLALLVNSVRIASTASGWLTVTEQGSTRHYAEIAPDRFRGRYDYEELYFHRDAQGRVRHMSRSGYAGASYRQLELTEQPALHFGLFGLCAMSLACYVCGAPVQMVRRRGLTLARPIAGKFFSLLGWISALGILVSLATLFLNLQRPEQFVFEIPGAVQRFIGLAPVLVGSSALAIVILTALHSHNPRYPGRVLITCLALGASIYVVLGWYWNLLP